VTPDLDIGSENVTEQPAVAPVPVRVQLVAPNVPSPFLVQPTLPVGVIGVPAEVSVTVAVQVVGWRSATVVGAQTTAVVVARCVTDTLEDPELSW